MHVIRVGVLCRQGSLTRPAASPPSDLTTQCTCTAKGCWLLNRPLGFSVSSRGFTDGRFEFDHVQLFSSSEPIDVTEEPYKHTESTCWSQECCLWPRPIAGLAWVSLPHFSNPALEQGGCYEVPCTVSMYYSGFSLLGRNLWSRRVTLCVYSSWGLETFLFARTFHPCCGSPALLCKNKGLNKDAGTCGLQAGNEHCQSRGHDELVFSLL